MGLLTTVVWSVYQLRASKQLKTITVWCADHVEPPALSRAIVAAIAT